MLKPFQHNFSLDKKIIQVLAFTQTASVLIAGSLYATLGRSSKLLILPLLISVLGILATLMLGLFFYYRYRSLPIVLRKSTILDQERQLTEQLAAVAGRQQALLDQTQRIEKNLFGAITARQAQTEKIIAQLAAQRRQVNFKESQELTQTLETLQADFLRQGMQQHAVRSATIPGIGPRFKERLAENNILTAYDIHTQPILSISGFGESKANLLMIWRNTIEIPLRDQMPKTLPAAVEASIKEHYQRLREKIDRQIFTEQTALQTAIQEIQQTYQQTSQEVEKQQIQANRQFALLEKQHNLVLAQMEDLRTVTFWNYLKACFSPVHTSGALASFGMIAVAGIFFVGAFFQSSVAIGSSASLMLLAMPTGTYTPTATWTPIMAPTETRTLTPTATVTPTATTPPTQTSTLPPTVTQPPATATLQPTATRAATRTPTQVVIWSVPKAQPTAVPDNGGPTALCRDGSYSYSAHHQGTCSHHGGVAVWYK